MRYIIHVLILISLSLTGCSSIFGPPWEPVGLTEDPEKRRALAGLSPHAPQPATSHQRPWRWIPEQAIPKDVQKRNKGSSGQRATKPKFDSERLADTLKELPEATAEK